MKWKYKCFSTIINIEEDCYVADIYQSCLAGNGVDLQYKTAT